MRFPAASAPFRTVPSHMLSFPAASFQSHDSHSCPVPWGGAGALPEIICEGKILMPHITSYFVFRMDSHNSPCMCLVQFVFKTEPYTSSTTRTVHEELAKAMTAILKPSTDFLTSNKLLKVAYLYFFKGLHSVWLYMTDMNWTFIVLWLMFVCPAVLLVFLWSLSQVHGSVLDWKL